MKLSNLKWPNQKLIKLGYQGYQFNLRTVRANTKKNPTWLHFGAGNIFRAFPAKMAQDLLNMGLSETGVIIAEGYDEQIIDYAFDTTNNLTLLATLKADGSVTKTVIASITEALRVNFENQKDFKRLIDIFSAPSLMMVSFTITEKGYQLKDNGKYYPDVITDFNNGVTKPVSYLGKLVYLLYTRYLNGRLPLSLVSMDNCAHNGDILKEAVLDYATNWVNKKLVSDDFLDYLSNPKTITYPNTMIDKITPRPDSDVLKLLVADGFSDIMPIVTSKNTYVAPFVNAEETGYLVIEDNFANGKIPLDEAGAIYTTKEVVDKVEKMKVGTCLNPLHTALAIFGCLLGYTKISDQLKNPSLVNLITQIGYTEGLKVVVDPKIINPKEFLDTVIKLRLPNPFIPDSPQRIATDTSAKLAIRFGQTINEYINNPKLDCMDLVYIPLVYAGYLRYLMAVDDNGKEFNLSPDPLLNQLKEDIKPIKFKDQVTSLQLEKLLRNQQLFGVDLISCGLDGKIVSYFNQLNKEEGSIKKLLDSFIS